MGKTVLDVLKDRTMERMENYKYGVCNSNAKSFDEYTKMCGIIQGLAMMLIDIQELAKQHGESEDE